MTELVSRLAEISDRYGALFVDLWGCLHDGIRPFSDAVNALQSYRAKGGYVMLVTNATRTKQAVLEHLDLLGVPHDVYDGVTSSGDASQAGMLAGMVGKRIYHLGPQKDESFFNDLDPDLPNLGIEKVALDQAEGIICTGLFDDATESPQDYRAILLAAKQTGLKLLCTNPDLQVDRGENRIYCAGSLAALYTEMGGESLYFGKPHAPIYGLARQRLDAARPEIGDNILSIGDGIRTDILGGLNEGLDTLFITGGLAAGKFGNDPNHPDPQQMQRFFDAEQITPTWATTVLR